MPVEKVSNPKKVQRLRQLLIEQDYKCFLCGEWLMFEDANLDHDVPKSIVRMKKGNNAGNLRATHRHCNNLKGAMIIDFKAVPKELEADKNKPYNATLKFRRSVVYHLIASGIKLPHLLKNRVNVNKRCLNRTLRGLEEDKLIQFVKGEYIINVDSKIVNQPVG